jgi:hypothetical protein
MHQLHPVIVGWVPLQLVVMPDLGGGGREGKGDSRRTRLASLFSIFHLGDSSPLSWVTKPHFHRADHAGPTPHMGGVQGNSASHLLSLGEPSLHNGGRTREAPMISAF